MSNAEMINGYLEWRQEKVNQLRYSGEEQLSPEAWIQETLMSDALVRINLIKDLLESSSLDVLEIANAIHSLVYDDLSKPIEDEEDEELDE